MKTRYLTAALLLSLSRPLLAQKSLLEGSDFFGEPVAAAADAPVPMPGRAEAAGGVSFPSDKNVIEASSSSQSAGKAGLEPIWKTAPSIVSKLTGPGSPNADGLDVQVKGTDLGSMFEHKGKMYFAFGDTNILNATPANHMSNVLAWTDDTDASDGIKFHYINFRDVYADVPDFYAKESDLQADEEIKENFDIDKDIVKNYPAHRQWASGQSKDAAETELLRKHDRIFNYYAAIKNDRRALADYYARLTVRLVNLGTSFSDDIAKPSNRNNTSYQAHFDWAMGAPLSKMHDETKFRYDRLFSAVEQAWVKQIFASKTFPDEYTDIPTNGVSIGGRIYIYFMSIRSWEPWTTNFAGIAYSDDDGRTFTRIDNFFPADSNFTQVSLVKQGGYLYLFGIPAGREGGVKLARVEQDKVLDKTAYRYCRMADGGASWVNSEAEANYVVPAPAGELSVQWNPFLNSWLMLYLNDKDTPGDQRHWIEARTAPALDKPWSREKFVIAPADLTSMGGWGIYGPFMHPLYTAGNGETVYFLLSMWSHYNVFVMKMTLKSPSDALSAVKK